jgi:hypothetical protein
MLGTFTNMDIDPVIPAENGYTHKESTDIVNILLIILKSTLASGRMS